MLSRRLFFCCPYANWTVRSTINATQYLSTLHMTFLVSIPSIPVERARTKIMQAGLLTYRQPQTSSRETSDLLFAPLRSAHSSGTVRDSHSVPFSSHRTRHLHCFCKVINNSLKEETFLNLFCFSRHYCFK